MAGNDSTADNTTPKKHAAVTGADHDAELSAAQAVLDRIMNDGDDRTKRLIFNRVLRQMTEALPELPPEEHINTAAPIPAYISNLLDAGDKLREAASLAEFIQSISLNVPHDSALILQPGQLTGFFFAMKSTIDRIKEVEVLIDTARKQPETLPA